MRKLIMLAVMLGLFAGCATTTQVTSLEQKVAKLQKQLLSVQMGKATGAAASIYPVTGALTGSGTGALDTITSTEDKDAAVVMFNDQATWGNAFMPYGLDVNGAGTEAEPYLIKAGDGGDEDWELSDTYGRRLFGHIQVISDADGCTVGDTCDGALTRIAWGGIILMTGTGTVVLPEIVAATPSAIQVDIGASLCVIVRDDNEAVTVDPHANDSITLDGTKDTAGDSIVNTVAAATGGGDFVCFVAVEADNWMVMGYKGVWSAN